MTKASLPEKRGMVLFCGDGSCCGGVEFSRGFLEGFLLL